MHRRWTRKLRRHFGVRALLLGRKSKDATGKQINDSNIGTTTHSMSRTFTLGRAVSQLATPSAPINTCRSCQLRISAASQQRQLQTSANRLALGDRFKSVFGGKKKDQDTTDVATSDAVFTGPQEPRKPDFPGWYLPKENLPEGWAKKPEEDTEYVVAIEGKDLEHVGSEKWLEQQFDDKPNYKGYEGRCI